MIEKYLKLDGYRKILSESVNHGIRPISSFIVGFPEESREEIDATILLGFWSKGTGAAKVAFHRLSPLASTKVYHDHVSELQFKGSASDMSITTLYNPEMVAFIRTNPDLFSSFFEIPTPQLGDVDLFCFTNFYNVLVDTYGPSMSWLFGKGRKTPFGFFEEWQEHTADRPPEEKFSPQFIFESAGELF